MSDDLIFPDELLFGKVIWEYRFEFEKIHLVQDWEKGGIHVPSHIMLNVGRRVVDPETFLKLVRKAEQKWQKNILEKLPHLRGRP